MRKRAWPRLLLAVALLLIALPVAGCGEARPQQAQSPQPAQPESGGTVTLAGAEPTTLDPALVQDSNSSVYVVEVFSGLVSLSRDLEVVPDLAEEWSMSNDGTRFTFRLRSGAKFHDGKEVTAQDVRYSLERAASPSTDSPVAQTYLGDIVGFKEVASGQATSIGGVEVVDKKTLRLTIDAAKVYFLSKLTHPVAFVVDKDNVESGGEWTAHPNGTGPFKLSEYRKGDRLLLERNPLFHLGAPKVERVVFLLRGGLPLTMYENNEVDIAGVGPSDLARLTDPTNPLNKELHSAEELSLGYFGFNLRQPPFDDPKVREAFALSLDRNKIVSLVLEGSTAVADGIVPPGMPDYRRGRRFAEVDVARAKELLGESRYRGAADLPEIAISAAGAGGQVSPLVSAAVDMWQKNLGVKVAIRQVDWPTYLADLRRGRFQIFELGWVADYPDPQDFLDVLFRGDSDENYTGYASPQVDALLEQANLEQNKDKRMDLYQQAEGMILDDFPLIPLTFGKSYVLVKPWVEGYRLAPTVVPQFRYLSVRRH